MIEYFAQSHVGLVRKGNEDSYYAPSQSRPKDPQFFLCVADGLGGHNAGEIASQLAVRTMVTSMQTMEGKNQMLDHPFETMQRPMIRSICCLQKVKRCMEWEPP